MNKIRTFRHVLRHSLYPVDDYYKKIVKKTSFAFSLKYFVFLIFFVSVIFVIAKTISFAIKYPQNTIRNYVNYVVHQYPDDLVMIMNDDGRLFSSYDRPYFMHLSDDLTSHVFLVVDTQAKSDKIYEYKSTVLLTERYIVINWNDQTFSHPYAQNNPLFIDKGHASSIGKTLEKYVQWYPLITCIATPLFIIVWFFVLLISKLIYLIPITLLVFFISQLWDKNPSLGKTYQIALHSSTAPILIEMVISAFGIVIPVAFWFLMMHLLFLAAGVYEAYKTKSSLTSTNIF